MQGAPGVDGNTVLYGTADPTSGVGVNGNFYINTATHFLFGPKSAGAWPAGTSLVGPAGPQGPPGTGGSGGGGDPGAGAFLFEASTTWAAPMSGTYLIKALGGGGGGGGGSIGAGGGAGGDCWTTANLNVGDVLNITIGAGGAGGADTGGTGGTGGDTIVSGVVTTMTAHGGVGGLGRTTAGGVAGGLGGAAVGGNLANKKGCGGNHAVSIADNAAWAGQGAGSRWGSGGRPGCLDVSADGEAGVAFGTGGGGGLQPSGMRT
jgi:hypothetical protein